MENDLPDDSKRIGRLTQTIEETAKRLGISRGLAYALANKGHDTRGLQAYLGHKNIQQPCGTPS